jgi:hypothetical protein
MAPIVSAIAGPGAPNFARGALYVVPDTGSNMLNAFLMYLECQCGGIQGLKWPQSLAQFPGREPQTLHLVLYMWYPIRFLAYFAYSA